MCRSIKVLRRQDTAPTEQEIHEAALQFVRKISGYRVPSQANTMAFDAAVKEVSDSSRRLLSGLARPPRRAAAANAAPRALRARAAAPR